MKKCNEGGPNKNIPITFFNGIALRYFNHPVYIYISCIALLTSHTGCPKKKLPYVSVKVIWLNGNQYF